MDVGLPVLAPDSFDCVVQDPPYDEHTHAAGRRGATGYREPTRPNAARAQISRARDLGFAPITPEQMALVAKCLARLTKRWVVTFCSLEMVSDWKAAYEAAGLDYVRCGIWHKLGAAPSFVGDRPAQAAEAVVFCHRPGRKRWNGGGAHAWWETEYEFNPVYEEPIVLNRGPRGERRVHTTQKPLALMERILTDFTDPGELVADPFCGSGTTLVAARRLGRRAVGWEVEPKVAEVARRRVEEAREQMGLFAKEGA